MSKKRGKVIDAGEPDAVDEQDEQPEEQPMTREAGPVSAVAEVLAKGEITSDKKEQIINVEGKNYHHIRELPDGTWVYTEVRPRD